MTEPRDLEHPHLRVISLTLEELEGILAEGEPVVVTGRNASGETVRSVVHMPPPAGES